MTSSTLIPVIQLTNVSREFQVGIHSVKALKGISLTIQMGEMVAIIGPSGSGKSTLMNTLGCLDQPSSGSFVLNGQDVSGLSDDQLAETRSRQLGFVFQSYNLLPRETALSNVELPLKYSGGYSGKDRRAARTALDRVGLSKRYDHRPMQMSGGEQQRVGIARAIAQQPNLILADEPVASLDPETAHRVLGMLHEITKQDEIPTIVSLHQVCLLYTSDAADE